MGGVILYLLLVGGALGTALVLYFAFRSTKLI